MGRLVKFYRRHWTQPREPNRDLHREDKMFAKMIDDNWHEFGQYRAIAQKTTNQLVTTLRASGLKIAQHHIVGSVGKRSSLGSDHNPDIDIALLLPKPQDVTFENVHNYQASELEKIKKILKANPAVYKFSRRMQKTQKYGITVIVEEQGLKLDIVTGVQFGPSILFEVPDSRAWLVGQWEAVMSYMSLGDLERQGVLCSSLAQVSTLFSKYQHDFVSRFVSLIRLWFWSNLYGKCKKFNGSATVLELIAIRVAADEVKKSGGNCSFTMAFEQFFSIMKQDLSKIRIWFVEEDYPKELRPVPGIVQRALKESLSQWKDNPCGMLLDPANPYHNFMADKSVTPAYAAYKKAAEHSFKLLQKHKKRPKHEDQNMSRICGMFE